MLRKFLMTALVLTFATGAIAGAGSAWRSGDFRETTDLTLHGDAYVTNSGTLSLTNPSGFSAGSVFSQTPVAADSFSTYFAFQITEPGNGGADGICFALLARTSDLGASGGGIGCDGINNSVAIEFDTWRNAWDPNGNHAGLLVNGDVTHKAFPAKLLTEQLENGAVWHVWVDYDATRLEMRIAPERKRPGRPVISHVIDVPERIGAPIAHIGFTSATGGAWARHTIIEWQHMRTFSPIGEDPTLRTTAQDPDRLMRPEQTQRLITKAPRSNGLQ